ncbi:MAG TPA: AzlD domain-containing protein [Symbiobacteriaceae bacterium]|nr:AzlD domain-containing protein [Symbiobacteriaceae bacterium]
MSVRPSILALFVGMALVTYIPRVLPLAVLSRFELPALVRRWLSFVPVSVLSALLAKELLVRDSGLALSLSNLYLIAAVPTFAVAIWSRSLMGTVVTGIASIAVLRLVM